MGGSFYRRNEDNTYLESDDLFNDRGEFVIAHEYGHHLHDEGLGGAGPNDCPSPHYREAAHTLSCAYAEGFANFHSAVIFPDIRDSRRTENNYYFENIIPGFSNSGVPLDDGSIVEGAVAAFLLDLVDPSTAPFNDESHDNTSYPHQYVADVYRTCQINGSRANDGIDKIIMCLEGRTVDYDNPDYFKTRSSFTVNSIQEGANEPNAHDPSDINRIWRTNLHLE